MKTLPILSLFICLTSLSFANDGKYIEAMQKQIQAVYKAKSIDELQSAVNALERIASAEKTKWEPYYYASFGYVLMATQEKEAAKKDTFLDQAMIMHGKAKEIAPEESEVVTLEGFIYTIRLTVDPATRGPRYAGLSMQSFNKAVQLNPENPRAWSMMAQMQYGTASFFGSPTTEACNTLTTALQKFDTFKSDSPLAPQWGRGTAEELKKNCQ